MRMALRRKGQLSHGIETTHRFPVDTPRSAQTIARSMALSGSFRSLLLNTLLIGRMAREAWAFLDME